jgi:hypothetical protein
VDLIHDEQLAKLSPAPQPDTLIAPGAAQRIAVGRQLHSDLIVVVRSKQLNGVSSIDVVVTETTGGLRLAVRSLPQTGDAAADVAPLYDIRLADVSPDLSNSPNAKWHNIMTRYLL